MKHNRYLWGLALLVVGTLPAFSQVSNDNEDGVYKIDERLGAYDFEPGQVLVKFKDESTIQVRSNEKGKFRAANINSVDRLLREYDVDVMEKLYPAEVAKPASQLRQKRAPNGTIVKERNLDKVFWVKTKVQSLDSTLQLIEELKAMPEVEYAEPNYRVYITDDMPANSPNIRQRHTNDIHLAPVRTETDATFICTNPGNNPLYSQQYGITQQNIHTLWNKRIINKKRPVIAILDTGVDITHPDLKDNIWQNTLEVEGEKAFDDDGNGIVDDRYGWNFVENYYDPIDNNGHGTHVAGIAAAVDNSIGVVGSNPLALIMPVKVINDGGFGDIATICRGLIYAAENGADIINMSFGHSGDDCLFHTEIDVIHNVYQSTIIVASAGNDGKSIYNIPCWPAAYHLVLGVQASDASGNRANFSNYDPDGPTFTEDGIDGRNYEIMVPGEHIYSTFHDGTYKSFCGTSMSAPLFAGAISALQMVKEYPSREFLWGDLIHLSADFEKIYDDSPRPPKIDLVALNIDDNVDGNSYIDGQVDVGEIIKISPVLRNTWAHATNIKMKLSVEDYYKSFVSILTPNVDFGYSLSAYGYAPSQTPFIVRFNNNIGDKTGIKFTLEIRCLENEDIITRDIYVTVNNVIKIGGMIASDITLTADKNYLVSSNLAIPEGVKLTIEPGTTLRFCEGVGISNNGILNLIGEPGKMITLTSEKAIEMWNGIIGKIDSDTLKYCSIKNCRWPVQSPAFENCIFSDLYDGYMYYGGAFNRCNIINSYFYSTLESASECYPLFNKVNIVNCYGYVKTINRRLKSPKVYEEYANWMNCLRSGYLFSFDASTPFVAVPDSTPYLGTSRIDIANNLFRDIDYGFGYGQVDLRNLRTEPIHGAHGIVWKVVVNGKDAQDEYEDMYPLGVGRHKFEVYFNRPMNKEKAPQISFGVREPYTQHAVDEDGSWNEEGTVYTAYITITGKTMSDGVNRIYVQGAEDDEYFECPYEKTRFNVNLQAAGSMATGFMGEPGLGKVHLTWNNENNDFEDAMGFNVYRYTIDAAGTADTICINREMVDIEATEYTDYDVVPGQTYYYFYKVLSTDLQEYDVSNVVAVTPLTASLGDANGSGGVDVADVITTVNYAAGMVSKPFIFEAADMNTDNMIDILDVIGIIQTIINPSASAATASIEATATYTIEDGVLYVESPVDLAGVQAQLNVDGQQDITVAEDLDGFEHTSAWLSDNDYLFLAYNMNGKTLSAGKHALLYIGDANLSSLRLSDALGHNVMTEAGQGTPSFVDTMGSKVLKQGGVFNLKGQKVAGKAVDMKMLPKGVYIINGQKVVK